MFGLSSRWIVAALVATGLWAGILVTSAHADAVKCKAAITKAGAAFVQAKAKALAKCEEAVVKGKLTAADCHADPKASVAIGKAISKLQSAIAKGCGGKDKICGVGTDDDTLASIGWAIGTCPNFESGVCSGTIVNCTDVANCVSCIGEAATDKVIALAYDAHVPSNPKTQKTLNKCQVAIGKATLTFLTAKSKALTKCWQAVNKNKATSPCPVPGDGKAAAAIAKAETKKRTTICKACGGADKLCNGVGDLTPAAIGFPLSCPDATVPGGGAVCGGAVTSLTELVDCVDCIAEFAVDCADRSAVPGLVLGLPTYPSECNPIVATPTPTETVTPGLTATPTATESPTPTATESPTPTATESPTPTATESPTPTVTATGETPTPTPTETATPTPTATATGETPTPTETATPTPTATATGETPTPTPTETVTPTPTATATGETPTPTETATPTPTATGETPTPTETETPTPTATSTSDTPTPTDSATPSPTETVTPTETSTPETATPTPTATETETPTPVETSTPIPTATETETPTPTATETATPIPTATETETPTPTPTATASDLIVNATTLGDYWGIEFNHTPENPPTDHVRQRISNAVPITIDEIDVCLGLQDGTETGAVHFEIWSDTTTGCAGGAPFCPSAKVGADSDDIVVDALALMQNPPSGACGSAGNGQVVTVKWAGTHPAPTGNFWIVGVNNATGGFSTGQVRWGASAEATPNTYEDTDFDSWKSNIDNDNDHYFVVRGQ